MTNNAEKKRILKERALVLQVEKKDTIDIGEKLKVLKFTLSDEQFGIDINFVKEVIFIKNLTPLPCTPDFILGIVNVRGKILSVIDIRKFLHIPTKGISNLNRVFIVHQNDLEFGIVADEILGNEIIPLNSLQSKLPVIIENTGDFIKGVTKERLIVLDIMHLMLDERIIVNEEI